MMLDKILLESNYQRARAVTELVSIEIYNQAQNMLQLQEILYISIFAQRMALEGIDRINGVTPIRTQEQIDEFTDQAWEKNRI